MKRRDAIPALGAFASLVLVRAARAQQPARTNFAEMEQGAYRPTLRPAKPGAKRQLTDDQRDALEHRIKCQCGCPLDVYTCRTTDFTCSVAPAMHRDVLRLIEGGYDGKEILAAFVETFGEVALTEPKKEGFNWAGYFAPGAALAVGAVAVTMMILRWSRTAAANAPTPAAPGGPVPGVTDEEMARLDKALREEG